MHSCQTYFKTDGSYIHRTSVHFHCPKYCGHRIHVPGAVCPSVSLNINVSCFKLFASAAWRCFRVPTLLRGNKIPRILGIIDARRRRRLPNNFVNEWTIEKYTKQWSDMNIQPNLSVSRLYLLFSLTKTVLESPNDNANSQVSRRLSPANNDPTILRLQADKSWLFEQQRCFVVVSEIQSQISTLASHPTSCMANSSLTNHS